MTRIVIRGADVITLDEAGAVYRGTDLGIEGENIAWIGEMPPDFVPDEEVDGRDRVVMPGFFNAHTHAAMTLIRGWAEDLPLERWFNERIWVAESALTEEDVYWGAMLAAAEMIRAGVVGFADHYFYMHRVAEVVVQSGLRANLAWCVFGQGSEVGTDLPGTAAFVEEWQDAANGRIRTVLGPHSPYICSPVFLARTAAVATRLGVGLHIHCAESPEQVENSLREHDRTPVQHLLAQGVFDVPCIAAHCIYINEEDQEILAAKDVQVVQCPYTHMKLGMGVTPAPELQALGVNVALGSDGAASGNTLGILKEARLANLVQKQTRGNPELMAGDTVLRMATQNGARAMGFPDSGVLAPGRPADLILLDFRRPHLQPRHDLAANVVHSANEGDVTHTMVSGRWLMRDGALQTLDEERILHEAEARGFRMVNADLRRLREYRA